MRSKEPKLNCNVRYIWLLYISKQPENFNLKLLSSAIYMPCVAHTNLNFTDSYLSATYVFCNKFLEEIPRKAKFYIILYKKNLCYLKL